MKMRTSWKKDKRAEMGVGTMIIFIAMVLVAAVAASVLISTANKVREQAQNTGDQAINNVASGFVVQDVTGQVDTGAMNILTIHMRLQAGSPAINMDLVSVEVITGTTATTYEFAAAPSATEYGAVNSNLAYWTADGNHVVQQGDMITVTLGTASTGAAPLGLGFSASATVKIVPAYGSATLISFVTPSYYDTTYVELK
jgi:flagellin FlaB